MNKLDIQNEMAAFDLKDRDYYKGMTDEEKKKFSTYLMVRWGSTVEGSADLQEYYLLSTNQKLNKNFFAISKHPQLQWLCATAVSPDIGKQRHNWIAPKKKETTGDNKVRKILEAVYPDMKASDLDVLASMLTKKEVDQYIKEMHLDV